MDVPLQPLRIPGGWELHYNNLYEIDPDESWPEDDARRWYFDEDLLSLHYSHRDRLVDVGWYPGWDLNSGGYGLVVFEEDFHGTQLHEFQTRSRTELVAELERILKEISEGKL